MDRNDSSWRARQPKGTSAGGQYATMRSNEARISLINNKHQMNQTLTKTLNEFDGLMVDGVLTGRDGQFQVNFMSANEDQHLTDGLAMLEEEARKHGFFELKVHPNALEDFDTPEQSAGFLSSAGYKFDGQSYVKELRQRPADIAPEPAPEPAPVKPAPAPKPPRPDVVKPSPAPEPPPAPETSSGTLSERGVPTAEITEKNYDGSVPVPAHLTAKYQELIRNINDPQGGEQGAVAFGALLAKRADVLAGFDVEAEAERLRKDTMRIRNEIKDGLVASRGHATMDGISSRLEWRVKSADLSDPTLKVNNTKLRDAYRQTLAEIRPMGGTAQTGKRAQKKAISYLNEATKNFPTEWVERSNTHGNPLVPKMSTRRAHYIPARLSQDGLTAPLTMNEESSYVDGQAGAVAVATHEFTHRMEDVVPGIYHLENQFRTRRTTLPNGRLEPLVPIYRHTPREKARVDHFASRYMGKVYGFGGYTEIMSTGTEALFGGEYGGLTGMSRGTSADKDMRNFILGVLGGHTVKN
ncbi:hypothetical protein ACT3UA_11435 [Glutamicibacter sp. 363]|uniref:hypothetical protein n=1 Tax=unclassified Glutamicibacter TaxID=2627139 RepID=UPI004034C49E